jgi:hypothetical protein
MIFDGRKWRRSNTVVILPPVKGEDNPLYIRFGRICKQDDKGAVKTNYKWPRGGPVYAKPIKPHGWGLTNKMYGKYFVRDGEVRVPAYLCRGGQCYTTSWVHEEKTIEYQQKKLQKRLDNS